MKIFMVARGYPSKRYRLNGIFEFDQAKALVEAGIDVVYLAIDVRSIRRWRKWGYESFIKDGVQIEAINFPGGRIPHNILNKISEVSLNKLYNKVVNKYGQPDIIHSHFIGMGHTMVSCLKNKNIPLIHTEHYSGMNQDNLNTYYQNLGNNTYKYMDKVIAVSKPLATNIRDKFNISATIVPNIVDTSIFRYIPSDNLNSTFDFISVGNLIKRKRMDLLINSFYNAFRDNNEVKLYIYGDGPERATLDSLIEKLNLSNQVFLMGLVDRQTIAKKMQESECFVLASELETFGVVYIEAMAAGLPVIATKCGGPEDFIEKSNGILIEIDNQEVLSKAMSEMYDNIGSYNREEISKRTINKFGEDSIAELIIREYQNLMKKKQEGNYND